MWTSLLDLLHLSGFHCDTIKVFHLIFLIFTWEFLLAIFLSGTAQLTGLLKRLQRFWENFFFTKTLVRNRRCDKSSRTSRRGLRTSQIAWCPARSWSAANENSWWTINGKIKSYLEPVNGSSTFFQSFCCFSWILSWN
jgi:hypothetical protein